MSEQYHVTFRPQQVHPSVWIAPNAVVVGDVTLAENVSVWFGAVLRGDTEALYIGAGSNIQDGCVLHADPGFPLHIGVGVTVGHRAVVHGARIGDNTLVGMGAIILNGAQVGRNCIIGAGALLTQGKHYPDNALILGSPARVIRDVSEEEIAANRRSAAQYVAKAKAFREGMVCN
ncbi:MAG: gamma carbonic anhydrase family protein [Chloroflexi bacterium]|nr:MAG: gamma carbonic anhydrase family protein [Chloroflexota bacterium]